MTEIRRPLQVVSLEKLSTAIAAAVSGVAGGCYSAEITQVDFESVRNSWMEDATMLTVRLKTSSDWAWRSHVPTAEDDDHPPDEAQRA